MTAEERRYLLNRYRTCKPFVPGDSVSRSSLTSALLGSFFELSTYSYEDRKTCWPEREKFPTRARAAFLALGVINIDFTIERLCRFVRTRRGAFLVQSHGFFMSDLRFKKHAPHAYRQQVPSNPDFESAWAEFDQRRQKGESKVDWDNWANSGWESAELKGFWSNRL